MNWLFTNKCVHSNWCFKDLSLHVAGSNCATQKYKFLKLRCYYHTHTHTHTHVCTNAYTHTHTHTNTYTHRHTHTEHTYRYTCTCVQTYIHFVSLLLYSYMIHICSVQLLHGKFVQECQQKSFNKCNYFTIFDKKLYW